MAFISHIKAVFSEQSFAPAGAERQTDIQTYVDTYKHTHTFWKTISVNQVSACPQPAFRPAVDAPGLKTNRKTSGMANLIFDHLFVILSQAYCRLIARAGRLYCLW